MINILVLHFLNLQFTLHPHLAKGLEIQTLDLFRYPRTKADNTKCSLADKKQRTSIFHRIVQKIIDVNFL